MQNSSSEVLSVCSSDGPSSDGESLKISSVFIFSQIDMPETTWCVDGYTANTFTWTGPQ
ncbi:Ankyrin repeat protein [Giardia duodenalis]|nr:Ankyrin repeat protein [Giardia intestinalis]